MVFWSNLGCGQCKTFLQKVFLSDEVQNYIKSGNGAKFAYFFGCGKGNADNIAVKKFTEEGAAGSYPFLRLYWKKADGSESSTQASRDTGGWKSINGKSKFGPFLDSTFAGYTPAQRVTLTYDANGGSGAVPAAVTVDKGAQVTLSGARLSKPGSVHSGWTIGGSTHGLGAKITLNETATAYAAWEEQGDDPSEPGQDTAPRRQYPSPEFDPRKLKLP